MNKRDARTQRSDDGISRTRAAPVSFELAVDRCGGGYVSGWRGGSDGGGANGTGKWWRRGGGWMSAARG